MTTQVPEALLAALDDLKARTQADPSVATSTARVQRVGTVVTLLKKAAADCEAAHLRGLASLLRPDVIGHPDQPDTILGRAKDGRYRSVNPGQPLAVASQRAVMDGLADINRVAGLAPYWWQERGKKPWTKHTKEPLQASGHVALRRALCEPTGNPRREPFRLRILAALELFWATQAPPQALIDADTTDLSPKHDRITLTINPPGRTEARTQTFPLDRNCRAALGLWLPVRRQVVEKHLVAGPDHPANQALFITLKATTGIYEDGSPRMIPPGLRISELGLGTDYSKWSRWLNDRHVGEPGWPVPTTIQLLGRGGGLDPRVAQARERQLQRELRAERRRLRIPAGDGLEGRRLGMALELCQQQEMTVQRVADLFGVYREKLDRAIVRARAMAAEGEPGS